MFIYIYVYVKETIDLQQVEANVYFISPSYSPELLALREQADEVQGRVGGLVEGVARDLRLDAKAIKLENPGAYGAFVAKYVAEHPASETASVASASDGEESAPVAAAAAKPKRVISDEQKAKMKAGREAAAAAKAAAKAAGEPLPAKTKTKGKTKAAAAPQSVGGGGSAPAAAPKAAAPVEDSTRTKLTIEGVEYFMDNETFNLYAIEADGSEGKYAGRYDGEEDTIDLTVGEDE